MPPLPPVIKALLLVNVAAYCLDVVTGGWLTLWFGLWSLNSGQFMPWQVVTHAFLHSNALHLFLNMLGLWMFGVELERMWGSKRFLQFYTAGLLSAAVVQVLFTVVVGGRSVSMGASGGLFAILLACAMYFPNRTIMPLFPPIPMKMKVFVFVFGAIELFLGAYHGHSGIGHFAHLGGMLGGFLMIRYWRGQPPFKKRRRLH
ncbi:rhomboid family intramembrane serine protease [Eleftheria terrae]|uniref:rhomboid family intramembrane serine protease n=1 Tax=Eleftheria terrae TaxID=1597781 RepID=UPI00263A6408|nr:rhomboid family intramembrane serine protease [Eleftheria terrae]WKB54273.1 rhomboid family intramembrane serine protease [Eleftheria terrae]